MRINQLVLEASLLLEKQGVHNPRMEAALILGYCLSMPRNHVLIYGDKRVSADTVEVYRSLVARRAEREPFAYIVGEREFWSLPFHVNRSVLIPRPETEFLLEKLLDRIRRQDIAVDRCIDMCCGSGAIAVVLALELEAKVIAVDCSEDAAILARENVRRHEVEKLVSLCVSDLFSAIEGNEYQLIVSNPPYVAKNELSGKLEPEVTAFEPHLALDGGEDGLDCIRRIASDVLFHLQESGLFCMEFGYEQGKEVREIFSAIQTDGKFFSSIEILQDYSGRDRIMIAEATQLKEN